MIWDNQLLKKNKKTLDDILKGQSLIMESMVKNQWIRGGTMQHASNIARSNG